ncbi:hypothetical protein B0H34DRAFT_675570 [Crassisporium funariophilum]|nr:hypothetical protein B0H34DRAFT_675570 [Crassisporium funariophilum]
MPNLVGGGAPINPKLSSLVFMEGYTLEYRATELSVICSHCKQQKLLGKGGTQNFKQESEGWINHRLPVSKACASSLTCTSSKHNPIGTLRCTSTWACPHATHMALSLTAISSFGSNGHVEVEMTRKFQELVETLPETVPLGQHGEPLAVFAVIGKRNRTGASAPLSAEIEIFRYTLNSTARLLGDKVEEGGNKLPSR